MYANASDVGKSNLELSVYRGWFNLILMLVVLCAACAGPGGSASTPQTTAALGAAPVALAEHLASGYSLEVLPDSFLGAEAQGTFTLSVEQRAGLTTVRVLGEDLINQRAFYALLHCPPGMALSEAQAGGALSQTEDVLSLCREEAGVVHLGAVLKRFQERQGISGTAEVACVTLRPGALAAPRSASSIPARTVDHSILDVNCTKDSLEWDYRLAGDYNQDGQVNLGDLTPLARYWGDTGMEAPDEIEMTGVSFPVDSIQQVLDTSGDAAIGLTDLTALGANFGAQITNWNIYLSTDPVADFPAIDLDDPQADGSVPSSIDPWITVGFAQRAVTDPMTSRLRFTLVFPPTANGSAFWVRPETGGQEGAPSNWSRYEQAVATQFWLEVEPETYLYDPGLHLSLSVCTRGPEQVVCRVDATDATTAKYLVFRTRFNNLEYNPQDFAQTPLVGDGAGGCTWLAGPFKHSGVAKFSNYDISSTVSQPTGDFTIIRSVFNRDPQPVPTHHTATYSSISLGITFDPDTALLSWLYGGHHDAGQDGDVWLDDFATLNYYWGQLTSDPLAVGYLADLNGNGRVEINDIGALGAYYTDSLTGYNVYASLDPANAPVDGSLQGAPSVAAIGHASLSDATGDSLVDRLRYSFTVPDPQPGMYLWVQPENEGEVGGVRQGDYVQVP